MSPSITLAPVFTRKLMEFFVELEKLSNIVTVLPFSKSDLTRYFPMKPAPPVTRTFIKVSNKVRLYLILITISF